MTTGLIIFSRMNSTRLPGKSLREIAGRSLLGHVIDRARRVGGDTRMVVATSDTPEDAAIATVADAENVPVFRGDLYDVLKRAIDCARHFGFDRWARICGDRPFLDPVLIERLIETHRGGDLDLATNTIGRTFPAGLATEIVATRALERVAAATDDAADREHVTPYIYRHPDMFRIENLESDDPSMGAINLAVDTADDLAKADWIASRFADPAAASLDDVVSQARAWAREDAPSTGTGG